VHAAAGGLDTPAEQMAVAVVEIAKVAAGQGVAFDVVDPTLFDLAFVLGRPRPTGGDEKAVVLGALFDMLCRTYRRLCGGLPYVTEPSNDRCRSIVSLRIGDITCRMRIVTAP
jgi:hypothetical protein